MKTLLTTILTLLLIYENCTSQPNNFIRITGKTLNEDGLAVPFVNISLKSDPSIGTYSNASGEFQIQFNEAINDSVTFSCIGFENITISTGKFHNAKDSLKIILHSKVYILDAVEIKSDTALLIVKKSIEKLKDNLGDNRSILQGFYREVIRSDKTYDRLVEAAVDIFDKGYASGEMQFKVREIRKSDDFRDMDWKMAILNYITPINGLNGRHESLFANDYIRNNKEPYAFISNAPLNDDFFNEVAFSIDSIVYNNNEQLLMIGIRPGAASELTGSKGHLYIRKKDYAILEMQFEYNADPDDPLVIPGHTFLHQTLIKYKDYNGKMYLSLLHRKSFRPDVNSTKLFTGDDKEGLFYVESLFVTNEIITEASKAKAFKKKERQKDNIDLYSTTWKYNEAFWKTYNTVIDRPLAPRIKKDIERESNLDEQFKKNSH